jgi:pyruvate,water dikinase
VRDRENLRFERTRVFAVVRRMFLALGGHLAAAGRIGTVRDVFYLTREEIFAHFDGAGVTADLAALVRLRRAEFEAYARGPAPPDRFETRGAPADGRLEAEGRGEPAAEARSVGDELRGTGCCPGVVRARVRVVRDPRAALGLAGRILVAERTDPGWTLLFPAARGLLVQRGSLLSHSAIVAREMGIPCVVGIPRLLETLADGELVQMDGATGIVLRLEAPTPAEEPGR